MDEFDYRIYVGLGNPGKKYEHTRHNIGFQVVGQYAKELGLSFKEEKRFLALAAKGSDHEKEVHFLLPQTYMNLSGNAVKRYIDFYRFDKRALLVVVDDIAIPFGEMRFKLSGSSGGHNGLESIQEALGSKDYARLRMGIGDLEREKENELADYVLSRFNAKEREKLPSFIECGVTVLKRLLDEGARHIMNDVNRRKVQEINHGE